MSGIQPAASVVDELISHHQTDSKSVENVLTQESSFNGRVRPGFKIHRKTGWPTLGKQKT
jgi:FAD synthase